MAFYKTLLFDADGTLLDFAAAEKNALTSTLLSVGIEPTDEVVSEYSRINLSLWKLLEVGGIEKSVLKIRRYEMLCEKFGFDADPKSMADTYLSVLSEQGILLDGAFELLSHLYGISDIHIITNGIKSVQTGRMARVPIKEFIKQTFISDEIGAEKPAKAFFDCVESNIEGFDREHTLVIGDSLTSDIKGAINAGIDCVWYNPEGKPAPEGMNITYTVDNLADIENIVLYGRGERIGDLESLISDLFYSGIEIQQNYSTKKLTSFRLGGECDLAVFPKDAEETISALNILRASGVPFVVLGNGSNCVFEDGGYRGAVVVLSECKELSCDGNTVTASAGVALSALSSFANGLSLGGLEFAFGIPGSVGGGVYMNAGAYGGMISDCIKSATVYDSVSGEVREYTKEELKLSYRHSVFTDNKNLTLLTATFDLSPCNREEKHEYMLTIMNKRRTSQPLELPSAGSTFKKPADDIHVSKMIDEMGLKGLRVGGVSVSAKHAGFLVNDQEGTTNDLKELIAEVREKFYAAHGIMLECEVIFIS